MEKVPERTIESGFKPETELLEVPGSPEIQEVSVGEYIANLPENQFFVYSPTAIHGLGFQDEAFATRSVSDQGISIALSELQKVHMPQTCEEITVFGGGKR